jgi:hypothetical protein
MVDPFGVEDRRPHDRDLAPIDRPRPEQCLLPITGGVVPRLHDGGVDGGGSRHSEDDQAEQNRERRRPH